MTYNLTNYLEFLTHIVDTGKSYSVINSYRSALNLILSPNEQDRKCINRFLKGVGNTIPPQPRYPFIWDPDSVLSLLKTWYPLNSLNLEHLTYKLVFLMAISSASRVQTLSKIKIKDILKHDQKIEVQISERIKTSAPNKLQPLLFFLSSKKHPSYARRALLKVILKERRNSVRTMNS